MFQKTKGEKNLHSGQFQLTWALIRGKRPGPSSVLRAEEMQNLTVVQGKEDTTAIWTGHPDDCRRHDSGTRRGAGSGQSLGDQVHSAGIDRRKRRPATRGFAAENRRSGGRPVRHNQRQRQARRRAGGRRYASGPGSETSERNCDRGRDAAGSSALFRNGKDGISAPRRSTGVRQCRIRTFACGPAAHSKEQPAM